MSYLVHVDDLIIAAQGKGVLASVKAKVAGVSEVRRYHSAVTGPVLSGGVGAFWGAGSERACGACFAKRTAGRQ